MKKLKELCLNSFGIELEQLIPLQQNLIPFGKNADHAKLFGPRVPKTFKIRSNMFKSGILIVIRALKGVLVDWFTLNKQAP